MGSALLTAQNIFRFAILITLCAGFLMIYFKLDDGQIFIEASYQFKRSSEIVSGLTPEDGDFSVSPAENKNPKVWYNGSKEVIWVGGCPRSGTTLSRAMLDAHPDIRCGEETHIIPLVLDFHAKHLSNEAMKMRLAEAKVTGDILSDALASYLLTIIWKHGDKASHLCNKDPMVLNYMDMVIGMFPNSLFVLMVRDGRAVCHSMISREVAIQGFDTKSYRGCLSDWSEMTERQYDLCNKMGNDHCRLQYYELLVLDPETEMMKLLEFLNVERDEAVLHHTDKIGETGGISLSS